MADNNSMDLKEFVAETLVQIIEAVRARLGHPQSRVQARKSRHTGAPLESVDLRG